MSTAQQTAEQELSRFIQELELRNLQTSQLQQKINQITLQCYITCIYNTNDINNITSTSSMSNTLSKEQQNCVRSCVTKFLDVSKKLSDTLNSQLGSYNKK